jgi:multimeric flavodoxin WrbA
MKRVLIIAGSPRKDGNSAQLCQQFMLGAQQTGHQAEIVYLRDTKLNFCLGCGACEHLGHCVQNDDMNALLDKLIQADVIVLATPVYFYTMNAQMKTFIDRCVPRYTQISHKEFYIIATAADSNRDALLRTVDGFHGFFDCLPSPQEKGVLLAEGVWKKGDIKNSPALQQAFAMGRDI